MRDPRHDPTSQAGSMNRYSVAKTLRIMDIARENRLPLINLVESGGADLPDQAEVFIVGGKWFRNLTRLSKMGIPTVAIVFGSSSRGRLLPAMCDYAVMVKDQAKVFLGGPPLVKMATGRSRQMKELGGAEMHSKISGLSDYFAQDEHEAIRMGRDIVSHLNWRKLGYGPTKDPDEPVHEGRRPARRDSRATSGPIRHERDTRPNSRRLTVRGVQGGLWHVDPHRMGVDPRVPSGGDRQPAGGDLLRRGAEGHRVHPAQQPVRHASRVHSQHHRIHGGKGLRAEGHHQGRGEDGQCRGQLRGAPHRRHGRGLLRGGELWHVRPLLRPSFRLWLSQSQGGGDGPHQLAGVMSIIARQAAESRGEPFDVEADEKRRKEIEAQIEAEELAYFSTARVRDDGLIDPRDTRHVLGIALSATHSAEVRGTDQFGVFRM